MAKDTVPHRSQPVSPAYVGTEDEQDVVPTTRPIPVEPGRITAPISFPDPYDGSTGPLNTDGMPVLGADGLPLVTRTPTRREIVSAARSRRRLLLRLGIAILSAVLLIWTLLMSPLTDSIASQPPRKPGPIPLAEVQPYGVNTFLHKEVDKWKKDRTLKMAQDMGVGWIKQQFPWAELEYRVDEARPYWDVKNNQNAWDKFDSIVDMAEQHGLRIIARIDSAPGWSHPNNPDPKSPPSPEHMDDFGNFIKTFVQRYHGRVSAIQVWNEPNLKGEWATGRPVNAGEYVQMLKTAYEYAKQADPNIIVLAAPLATTNETLQFQGNLNEAQYLQEMYEAGAKDYFDTMSANAYGKEFPPEDEPSREKLNFRRVELLRKVMEDNGDANKAVWFNEYGWNASPPDMSPDQLPWGRVTPEQQADYIVRGIRYAREHWPWAGVFTIWYLRQVGDIPRTASEYYFGLVDPDFVPMPAYYAVQTATTTQDKAATPGEWGPLSPAVQAGPRWQVRLDLRAPGGAAVAPSAWGTTLDIPFVGTDVKLALLPGTDAPDRPASNAKYYVTVDGNSTGIAPELPRDQFGRAYIDLSTEGQASDVVVVRGLGDQFRAGRHVLQIRVDGEQPEDNTESMGGGVFAPASQQSPQVDLPAIGAITVGANRSYLLFAIVEIMLLVGIGVLLWTLKRGRSAREVRQPAR